MTLNQVIGINKPAGLTPLQALDQLRQAYPEYQSVKLSYAGRLDPLAEGLMLVLVGEAARQPSRFWYQDKVYQAEILLGASTDTGDIMGLVFDLAAAEIDDSQIKSAAESLIGHHRQTTPTFSAPGLDGKILVKEIAIFDLLVDQLKTITPAELLQSINHQLALVSGDFRQAAISRKWQTNLADWPSDFKILPINIHCSAGTYIRVLAETLGQKLSLPALAYHIKRLKVGKMELSQAKQLPDC